MVTNVSAEHPPPFFRVEIREPYDWSSLTGLLVLVLECTSNLFISEEFLPMKEISSLPLPFSMPFMEYNYLRSGKWRTKLFLSKAAINEFELDKLYFVCVCV